MIDFSNYEDTQIKKVIYLCVTKGCGEELEGKKLYCDFCKKAENRKQIEDEWNSQKY